MEARHRASQTHEETVKEFLSDIRVGADYPFTHVTKFGPSGKYHLPLDDEHKFLTIYCNAVKRGARIGLAERASVYAPLRIDCDFKACIEEVGGKRQYTHSNVKDLILLYQTELRHIVDPDYFQEKMLWCVLLEKSAPRVVEGNHKDGFHLHFPYFICDTDTSEYLRELISRKAVKAGVWSKCKITTAPDSILDTNIGTKPWLMYGAVKEEGAEPYMWSTCFDENLEELEPDTVFEQLMEGRKQRVTYYLPRFLSIRGHTEPTQLTEEFEERKIQLKPRKRTRRIRKVRTEEEVMKDIHFIQEGGLMNMLSDKRAEDYEKWMDVGWTLFNIGQGCEEALELWVEFSQHSEKYVDGECEEKWNTMNLSTKSIASLLYMARSDSPDAYRDWRNTNIKFCIEESLRSKKPNPRDISAVVYKMYETRFVCAHPAKNLWYEFKNHRWNRMNDNIELQGEITFTVAQEYKKYETELAQRKLTMGYGDEDQQDHSKIQAKQKKLWEIYEQLGDPGFIAKLIKMCKIYFYDNKFLLKMNENRDLLGCENGVLDLELGHFRDGRPDDYITYSTGLFYSPFHKEDMEIAEVNDFLEKVYPNKNIREYMLDFLCSCLKGGNIHKIFMILSGEGNNAKSVTVKLLENVFGEYCIKFPTELFTKRANGTSGPRPELSRARGRRIAIGQEISSGENFNVGVIKELTGNDSFFVRDLYVSGEDAKEIKPMFTLIMQCNEPPRFTGSGDTATWNRTRLVPHESTFDDKAPKNPKRQVKKKHFPCDPNFDKKLPELAPALLYILFNRYRDFKLKGSLKEPEEVMLATNNYRADNDIFCQFELDILEQVEIGSDEDEGISLKDLNTEFQEWYKDNYPSSVKNEKIGQKLLIKELKRRMKSSIEIEKKKLFGRRFIQEDEEEPLHEGSNKKLLGKSRA